MRIMSLIIISDKVVIYKGCSFEYDVSHGDIPCENLQISIYNRFGMCQKILQVGLIFAK